MADGSARCVCQAQAERTPLLSYLPRRRAILSDMRQIPRVMPALITPFDARGEIDIEAHTHNVDLMWERDMRGLLIGGSTGEGPYLEQGERASLVAAARQARPGAFLMCGIAAESLRGALAQADEAAQGGADAVLALTPTTLVRQRASLITRFFADLAGRSPLPVLLYSVPPFTAYELPMDAAVELSRRDGVIGMKDSGGNPVRATTIARQAADDFKLFAGASAALALSVGGGAYGGITASANYAPGLVMGVVKAARRSARAAAPFQEVLATLAGAIEPLGIGGIKAAAEAAGLRSGPPRRPLAPATATQRRTVQEAMHAAGLT